MFVGIVVGKMLGLVRWHEVVGMSFYHPLAVPYPAQVVLMLKLPGMVNRYGHFTFVKSYGFDVQKVHKPKLCRVLGDGTSFQCLCAYLASA